MSLTVIEFNDQEIRVARDRHIVTRSPAAALLQGANFLIGDPAKERACIEPQNYHNKFWNNLNETPLPRPNRSARHHADLAFHHLSAILVSSDLPSTAVFAVPGSFSDEQLGRLLGIADAAKVKPTALVDAAVASAAASPVDGRACHVEIQLHRCVVTTLDIDAQITRHHVQVIDDAGFAQMNARLVAYVADQFLNLSRFDALHNAETEQFLHTQMAAWLAALEKRREIKAQFEYRGSRHEARLARDEMIEVLAPYYDRIAVYLDGVRNCLVGDRLASMPGFLDLKHNSIALPESAVFDGCASLANVVASGEKGLRRLLRISALSATPSSQTASDLPPAPRTNFATHVQSGATAFAIKREALFLYNDGTAGRSEISKTVARISHNDAGEPILNAVHGARVSVDGSQADAITLAAGNEITIDDGAPQFLAIAIEGEHAP